MPKFDDNEPGYKRQKSGRRIKNPNAVMSHLKVLDPIPESATDNPVEWASNHLEKQIPLAAKELEWQLKFGDSRVRREISLDMLAFKGISSRGPTNNSVVPAIQLVLNGVVPWSQNKELGEGTNSIDGQVVNDGEK